VWLMQPKAQTTTRGFLVVSAGTLEVLLQYIGRFSSGPTLTLTLTLTYLPITMITYCTTLLLTFICYFISILLMISLLIY